MAKRNINQIAINATTLNGKSNYREDRLLSVNLEPQKWYRIAELSSSFRESVIFSCFAYQGNQALSYVFAMCKGERAVHLEQIGSANFIFNNELTFRIVKRNDSIYKFYLEVYNGFKEDDTYMFTMGVLDLENTLILLTPQEVPETSEDYSIVDSIKGREMNDSIDLSNTNDMNISNLEMEGGIENFLIGDYAVSVRQKGGQRNGEEEYKRSYFLLWQTKNVQPKFDVGNLQSGFRFGHDSRGWILRSDKRSSLERPGFNKRRWSVGGDKERRPNCYTKIDLHIWEHRAFNLDKSLRYHWSIQDGLEDPIAQRKGVVAA